MCSCELAQDRCPAGSWHSVFLLPTHHSKSCQASVRRSALLLLLLLLLPQVTLLANGRLMYHGVRDGMVDWFGNLGYVHDALEHGVASDWALDLVAVGFAKPPQYFGHTMRSKDDLAAASQAFLDHYMRVGGHTCDDQGRG